MSNSPEGRVRGRALLREVGHFLPMQLRRDSVIFPGPRDERSLTFGETDVLHLPSLLLDLSRQEGWWITGKIVEDVRDACLFSLVVRICLPEVTPAFPDRFLG